MLQDGTTGVLALGAAARAAAEAALASFAPAGCIVRLLSSYGTVGPCPGNHEALIRDCAAGGRHAIGAYEIAHVSTPVPGAVVVASRVGPAGHLPAAVSIGWVVRTTGTGERRLSGLLPLPFGAGRRTYHWLLRDGAVRAHLLNGHESWGTGRRYVESLDAAVARGHIKRVR